MTKEEFKIGDDVFWAFTKLMRHAGREGDWFEEWNHGFDEGKIVSMNSYLAAIWSDGRMVFLPFSSLFRERSEALADGDRRNLMMFGDKDGKIGCDGSKFKPLDPDFKSQDAQE